MVRYINVNLLIVNWEKNFLKVDKVKWNILNKKIVIKLIMNILL